MADVLQVVDDSKNRNDSEIWCNNGFKHLNVTSGLRKQSEHGQIRCVAVSLNGHTLRSSR